MILQTSHGRRSIDVLKDLDASKANWECKSVRLELLYFINITEFMVSFFIFSEHKDQDNSTEKLLIQTQILAAWKA